MRLPLKLAAVCVAALAIAGCAVQPAPTTSLVSSTSSSASADTQAQPSELRITLDTVSLIADDGSTLQTLPYDDAPALLELLTDLLGEVPAATPLAGYPIVSYEWPGVALVISSDTYASVQFTAQTSAGLTLRGPDGTHVGMTRGEVLDAGAEPGYDGDADGLPEELRLLSRTNPDVTSLADPSKPGTDFVAVFFEQGGDVVTTIVSPANDYSDL